MESKFKVGDVVNLIDNPSMYYVVTESILIDNDIFRRYQYEVSDIRTDDTFVYDESSLELQYHDRQWEEYFAEGTRQNGLPAWRGSIYNAYDIYEPNNLRYGEKYDIYHHDDTLPLYIMVHILTDHTMYHRINDLFGKNGDGNINGTSVMYR